MDVVKPNNNEEELINNAIKLGYKTIILLYKKPTPKQYQNKKIRIRKAIHLKDPDQAHRHKKDQTIILEGTRNAYEKKSVLILPDMTATKDHTHYKNSGLDQIRARQAAKNKNTILLDFSLLQKNKEQTLGRMMQNARLCKKYKTRYEIVSMATKPEMMRSPKDFQAMKRVLEQT